MSRRALLYRKNYRYVNGDISAALDAFTPTETRFVRIPVYKETDLKKPLLRFLWTHKKPRFAVQRTVTDYAVIEGYRRIERGCTSKPCGKRAALIAKATK